MMQLQWCCGEAPHAHAGGLNYVRERYARKKSLKKFFTDVSNTTFLHALDACVGRWVIAIRRRNGVTQILGKLLPTLIQI